MSEIDQAFIKAYQEARATLPAKRPAASSASPADSGPQRAGRSWRLDPQHAAGSHDAQGPAESLSPSRVPTPHLHIAARGAAWLERPQPQFVAAVAQEFVAEEFHGEEAGSGPVSDPWIVPSSTQASAPSAPRAMSPGFGSPTPPKETSRPSAAEGFTGISNSIKPTTAPPPSPIPSPLPVRPLSAAPWSPTSHIARAKQASPKGQRIGGIEEHTEEMTQQLASVASTLARLEGDAPTEICLEQKEVTLVVCNAPSDEATIEQNVVGSLEAKLATLTPSAKRPDLKIAAAPDEVISRALVEAAEAIVAEPIEIDAAFQVAPPTAAAETAAKADAVSQTAAPGAAPVVATPVAEKELPAAAPIAAEKFQPQWEVDQFQWPEVLDRLVDQAGEAIDAACDAIQATCQAGQRVLAITGVDEAVGSTTLLLALSRQLAQRGMRIAIVDADFDRPTLAERTGLRIQHGWEATLTGSLPLEEVTVASLQDGVTLVPLVARQGVSSTMASLHAAKHLRRLREHFDAVLIDAGVGSENVAALATATADDALDIAVVLTVDERRSEPAATSEVVGRLRHCGIHWIQIGETFVSA